MSNVERFLLMVPTTRRWIESGALLENWTGVYIVCLFWRGARVYVVERILRVCVVILWCIRISDSARVSSVRTYHAMPTLTSHRLRLLIALLSNSSSISCTARIYHMRKTSSYTAFSYASRK